MDLNYFMLKDAETLESERKQAMWELLMGSSIEPGEPGK